MEIGWLGLIAIVLGSWVVLITIILVILASAFEEWKKDLPEPFNEMSIDELWNLYVANKAAADKAKDAAGKIGAGGGMVLPLHKDGGLPKAVV